jgi:type IV pilus assembly protein PilN
MLRINLMPEPRKAISTGPPRFTFLLVVLVVLLALGGVFLQNKLQAQIEQLEQTRDRKERTKADLKDQLREIHAVNNQLKEIKSKITVIKDIRKEQTRPLHYLNGLIESMPPEKIWFNSIQMQSNKNMRLTGIALDNQAFAQFVGELRERDFFKDITLKQTSRKSISSLDLVSFQCTLVTK